ncbi:MAG: 7TM-DISM domain-containing protein, partial [Thermoflexibacter sp.]|nr:7TM-DISM domain-containing protein [Thermoflexibacter sp.]
MRFLFKFNSSLKYLWVLFLLCSSSCDSIKEQSITVKNGFLDLSDYHFEKEGTIRLNGTWAFYWKQYLHSADFEHTSPSSFIAVPNSWANEEIEKGVKLGSKGHATYRLLVKLPISRNPKQLLGLRTQFIGTNHVLFIDNELVSRTKDLGANSTDTDGYVNPEVYFFQINRDTVEIVLHVANYAGRVGGITQPIFLGNDTQIRQNYERNMMVSFLLFGVLMIMSGYHFSLYAFRPKELPTLWFALFCFVIGLRILVTDDYYFSDIFPHAPYELGNKISYLTFYLGVPLFAIFIRSLFPKDFSKIVVNLSITIGSIYSTVVLFSTTIFYSQFLQYFQIATLLIILYAIYFVILILYRRRAGSAIFASGIFVIFIA